MAFTNARLFKVTSTAFMASTFIALSVIPVNAQHSKTETLLATTAPLRETPECAARQRNEHGLLMTASASAKTIQTVTKGLWVFMSLRAMI